MDHGVWLPALADGPVETIGTRWLTSIEALAQADSVTIDLHKLGYVPYPAGALLISRWILEGSKPAAGV